MNDIADMEDTIEEADNGVNVDERDNITDRDIGDTITFKCTSCEKRTFNTYRGMNQHLRRCIMKTKENITVLSTQPITAEERVSLTNSRGLNEHMRTCGRGGEGESRISPSLLVVFV